MEEDNKFPINRIVAFAGPYIAVLSGALADWLLVHMHLFSIFHTTHTVLANAITQVTVFAITALLVWAGHQKWLTGWQSWERAVAREMPNGHDVVEQVSKHNPKRMPEARR